MISKRVALVITADATPENSEVLALDLSSISIRLVSSSGYVGPTGQLLITAMVDGVRKVLSLAHEFKSGRRVWTSDALYTVTVASAK